EDGLHDGREAGDGARAQVVAVREAAREHDTIVRGEVALAVPDEVSADARDLRERVLAVVVAPGAGEDDDSKTHAETVIARQSGTREQECRQCPTLARAGSHSTFSHSHVPNSIACWSLLISVPASRTSQLVIEGAPAAVLFKGAGGGRRSQLAPQDLA